MNGISSATDSPRPGQAHPVVTPEGIAAVEAIVKENRRVPVSCMGKQWRLHRKNEVLVYLLCSVNYEIKNI